MYYLPASKIYSQDILVGLINHAKLDGDIPLGVFHQGIVKVLEAAPHGHVLDPLAVVVNGVHADGKGLYLRS